MGMLAASAALHSKVLSCSSLLTITASGGSPAWPGISFLSVIRRRLSLRQHGMRPCRSLFYPRSGHAVVGANILDESSFGSLRFHLEAICPSGFLERVAAPKRVGACSD